MNGDTIEAIVLGSSGEYETRVNILDFGQSQCDCPYDDYCKHMVAVVYATAQEDIQRPQMGGMKAEVTPDHLVRGLSELHQEQLLKVLELSLQDKPEWASHLHLWLDRWKSGQSLRENLAEMDVQETLVYFRDRVAEVIAEAETMFKFEQWEPEPRYNRRYDRWRDPDDEEGVWDYQEGVKHIQHWCDELEETAKGTTVMSALLGLGITLVAVSAWTSRNPEEVEIELTDAVTSCEVALERTAVKLHHQLTVQPDLRKSVVHFTNWIAEQGSDMLDLGDWTQVLSACLLDGQHLRQFKEHLLRTNPNFLHSTELYQPVVQIEVADRHYNETGRYLVDWWCNLAYVTARLKKRSVPLNHHRPSAAAPHVVWPGTLPPNINMTRRLTTASWPSGSVIILAEKTMSGYRVSTRRATWVRKHPAEVAERISRCGAMADHAPRHMAKRWPPPTMA